MTYLVDSHVCGHTPESKNWEHLVVIIRLHNTSNLAEGSLVLVVWTHIVKTGGTSWGPITASVIDGHSKRKLPASSEVVCEAGHRN